MPQSTLIEIMGCSQFSMHPKFQFGKKNPPFHKCKRKFTIFLHLIIPMTSFCIESIRSNHTHYTCTDQTFNCSISQHLQTCNKCTPHVNPPSCTSCRQMKDQYQQKSILYVPSVQVSKKLYQ